MTDAVAHFSSVTGHPVPEDTLHAISSRRAFHRDVIRRTSDALRSPVSRGFLRIATTIVSVYVLMFFASTFRDTPIERMAHLRSSDFSWTELGVSARGDDTAWGRLLINQYEEALAVAASSRKTFLGLFPTYQYSELRRARILLHNTIKLQSGRESVRKDAFITLAKLHFLLGDRSKSLDALQEVINLEKNGHTTEGDWIDSSNARAY